MVWVRAHTDSSPVHFISFGRRARTHAITMLSGVELAQAVLAAKDRYKLLSLGAETPIKVGDDGFLNVEDEDVRRAYMKIATRIHPDKLPTFANATRAFQCLVRAYELCCKPDVRGDESDDSRDDDDDDEDEKDDEDDEDNDGDSDYSGGAVSNRHKAPTKKTAAAASSSDAKGKALGAAASKNAAQIRALVANYHGRSEPGLALHRPFTAGQARFPAIPVTVESLRTNRRHQSPPGSPGSWTRLSGVGQV